MGPLSTDGAILIWVSWCHKFWVVLSDAPISLFKMHPLSIDGANLIYLLLHCHMLQNLGIPQFPLCRKQGESVLSLTSSLKHVSGCPCKMMSSRDQLFWSNYWMTLIKLILLPPASAVEVIESVPCVCVCLLVCETYVVHLGTTSLVSILMAKGFQAKGLCMARTWEVHEGSGVFIDKYYFIS